MKCINIAQRSFWDMFSCYYLQNGDVYLEAQIQNITPAGIYLERVALEPAAQFVAEDLSHTDNG